MKAVKHILTCGGIALVASSCASDQSGPLSSKAKTATASSLASASERDVAEQVFRLVNNERERAGKRAMRGHQGLNSLAQKHSNQMSSTSHGAANHSGSQNRAQYAYLKYNIENLSEMTYAVPSGTGDPASVAVAAWKSSSQHSRLMLQSWDLTGIGVSISDGTTYVTMCIGAQFMGVPRSVRSGGW